METATLHCESWVCGEKQHSDEIRGRFTVILSYTPLCTKLNIGDKPHLTFNIDETEFFSSYCSSRKLSPRKQLKDVKFTHVGRGENVIVVASRSASGAVIPPLLLLRGLKCTNRIYPRELKSH